MTLIDTAHDNETKQKLVFQVGQDEIQELHFNCHDCKL